MSETIQHIVAECSVFENEKIYSNRGWPTIVCYTASCIDLQDLDTFTRLVFDPSAVELNLQHLADEFGLTQVELYTRARVHVHCTYTIHKKRG